MTYKNQYDSSHFNSYYAPNQKRLVVEYSILNLITQKLLEEKNFENYDISETQIEQENTRSKGGMKTPEVDQRNGSFPNKKFLKMKSKYGPESEQINHHLKRTVFQRKEAWDTSVSQNSIYPIGSSFSVKDSERELSDETLQEFLREASVVTFRTSTPVRQHFPQDSVFLVVRGAYLHGAPYNIWRCRILTGDSWRKKDT